MLGFEYQLLFESSTKQSPKPPGQQVLVLTASGSQLLHRSNDNEAPEFLAVLGIPRPGYRARVS